MKRLSYMSDYGKRKRGIQAIKERHSFLLFLDNFLVAVL
jgi:hypothetical protein